ncbi:primase-helicase family protein [Candidatus Sulfurimonas baltica]|uniref:NrS-1 polymerase-like helicase domain-containing protein n=1 Tax=Candidatus Sulfurimonas baltica TaxID=2740404 RepID=A0A7S7LSU2_9BACT|nr:primase-helicase family protein [Candidatus Sulfurimonas baltica]QOY50916.1 hypothetical protein HUE88_07105 [Candidatus Sulfurimonas baltica]
MKKLINNCYDKNEDSELFIALKDVDMYLWITDDGDFAYRIGDDGKVIKVTASKLKMIVKNRLKFAITIDDENAKEGTNLDTIDLHVVSRDIFNPFSSEEFCDVHGEICRNTFRTTEYMEMQAGEYKEPKAILALIMNLVNNNQERFVYFLNWFAYFFQTLRRPMTAILIKGKQGSGKNLLVSKVLAKLLGEAQTSVIGDKAIRSNYIGGMFQGKLFYQFDEISHSAKDNVQMQNTLKEIVTNNVVQLERKFVDLVNGIEIFGLCLFTTNKPSALAIEHNDRRYSVFTTGENLNNNDFLGYGTYEDFSEALEAELDDFAVYLKSFKVDEKLANTCMDTLEKQALVSVTNSRFINFHTALISKDIGYFEELKNDSLGISFYNQLESDFSKDVVSSNNIANYYTAVESDEISSTKLLKQLRTIDSEQWHTKMTIGDGSGRYYLLENHPKREEKLASLYGTVEAVPVVANNVEIIKPMNPSLIVQ